MAISINVVGSFDSREIDRAQKRLDTLRSAAERSAKGQMGAWDKASSSIKKYDRQMTIAGGAVLAGLALTTKAASDLSESASKVQVVFGDSADDISAWADTSADAFLMSRQEALETAGTFGNLLTAMGMSEDKAGEWSKSMTELAADLASFNNTSVDEAILALRSGLSGEAEPLKKFGVALTDVRLKEEALRMGLIETTKGTLPPAIKMQASYSLIMKDTAKAQGDVERTSDGMANQQRRLTAEFKNAQAEIGTALLPAMTGLVTVGADALALFNGLPDGVKSTTTGVLLLSGAALVLAPRIVATVEALQAAKAAATGANIATAAAGGAFTVAAGLAIYLASGVARANGRLEQMDKLLDEGLQTGNMDQFRAAVADVSDEIARFEDTSAFSFKGVQQGWAAIAHAAAGEGNILDDLHDKRSAALVDLNGYEQAIRDVSFATGANEESLRAQAEETNLAGKSYLFIKDSLGEYVKAQKSGTVAGQEAAEAQVVLNDVTADAADVVGAYRQELDSLDGGYANVQEAQDNFHASIDDVTASLKENGATLDGSTEKGRANRDALRGMADKARDLAEATLKQTGSQDRANAKLQRGREELVKAGVRFGLTKKQAEDYATQLGLIPKAVSTKVKLTGKEKVLADLKALREGLADLGSPAAARIAIEKDKAGRAGGGYGYGSTLVGERGPEIVDLPRGSYVHDAGQTSRMLGRTATSGAQISITIDARGAIDPAAVEAAGYRGAQRALAEVLQEVRAS